MRAAAAHATGSASLRGMRVGVAGAGKVGRKLVKHLLSAEASVIIADVNAAAAEHVRHRHPEVELEAPEKLLTRDLDIYAPCALGGVLTEETVPALQAHIVCGGANNQLAHECIATLVQQHGMLYLPDHVVNSGGLIQVADEITGFNHQRARARAEKIFDSSLTILDTAADTGTTPDHAARLLAERRMTEVGRPTTTPG